MKFLEEDQYKNSSGIYKIQQISSGLAYIGQTKMKFIKRYWHHTWKLKNNTHDNKHLQNSWNKYGDDDFVFEVIHVLDKNECMNELEIQYIKQFNSFVNGFNMTTGGEGKKNCPASEHAKKITGEKNRIHNLGKKASDETKAKMSKAQKGRKLSEVNKNKLRASRLGVKWSDEHKQNLSKSHSGDKNAGAVINESIAYEIKRCLIDGLSVKDIIKNLGVSRDIIRSIQNSRAWTCVKIEGWNDYIYKYNNEKPKYLSKEEVIKIRSLLSQNITALEISRICNIGLSVIYGIKQNRTYKDVI